MAHRRLLSRDVLADIANQVADYLPSAAPAGFGSEAAPHTPELHECFRVVTIPDDVLAVIRRSPPGAGSELDLSLIVTETGFWHYQLRINGRSTGYVQTIDSALGKQKVRGVAVTPESESITAAFASISGDLADGYDVVLLDLPKIAVGALVLLDVKSRGSSYVSVFRSPDPTCAGVDQRRALKAADFLLSILDLPRVSGVNFD